LSDLTTCTVQMQSYLQVGLKYIQTKSEFAWSCCSHFIWTTDSQ